LPWSLPRIVVSALPTSSESRQPRAGNEFQQPARDIDADLGISAATGDREMVKHWLGSGGGASHSC
jgi:hypothetical protein